MREINFKSSSRCCAAAVVFAVVSSVFFALQTVAFAETADSLVSDAEPAIVINDTTELRIAAFGKPVIVNGTAKEVFVFGGDIVVNGEVKGDVGVIGGNVIQNRSAFIGGDVIVIGGSYRPADRLPRRSTNRETVVFGIFEEELREIGKNPASILSPTLSMAFLAQRTIAVIFWFIVTMMVGTIAPGAVSRAVAALRLSPTKVAGAGLGGLTLVILSVAAGAAVLPDYLSAMVWLMAFVALTLAYLFGRVSLQIAVGKAILKQIHSASRSESTAAIAGVLFWTIILSLPYVWTIALLAVFAAGVGLVLTAKRPLVIADRVSS
ncbi:MAG: hypothetical protein C4324_10070 [Blastocatellia bacterium]